VDSSILDPVEITSPAPHGSLLRPWRGKAFIHVPDKPDADPLNPEFSARSDENRWNEQGQPTLYFANDVSTLLAECARHLETDEAGPTACVTDRRRIFAVDFSLEAILDLRDDGVLATLEIDDAPHAFLDRSVARSIASRARRDFAAQAIIAPSMAFLDNPSRWNLVCFVDAQPDVHQAVERVTTCGVFDLDFGEECAQPSRGGMVRCRNVTPAGPMIPTGYAIVMQQPASRKGLFDVPRQSDRRGDPGDLRVRGRRHRLADRDRRAPDIQRTCLADLDSGRHPHRRLALRALPGPDSRRGPAMAESGRGAPLALGSYSRQERVLSSNFCLADNAL
jgi:RES domain-containing protein